MSLGEKATYDIASINQDNENRDAAATAAAAVAATFLPDATVAGLIETMMTYSADIVRRALVLTMDLVYASRSVDEFAEKFYAKMLDWTWPSRTWNKERFLSGSSLEIVPIVAGILHLCEGDVNESIIEAASFDRDCDTTASLAGAIAGAMHGASAIRQDWIETTEKGNAQFFEELEGDPDANFYHTAQRLVEVLKQEQRAAQERAELLGKLLE